MPAGKLIDELVQYFQRAAQQVQRIRVLLFGEEVVEELFHIQSCVLLHLLLLCLVLALYG